MYLDYSCFLDLFFAILDISDLHNCYISHIMVMVGFEDKFAYRLLVRKFLGMWSLVKQEG
jgi:hypothetical protein